MKHEPLTKPELESVFEKLKDMDYSDWVEFQSKQQTDLRNVRPIREFVARSLQEAVNIGPYEAMFCVFAFALSLGIWASDARGGVAQADSATDFDPMAGMDPEMRAQFQEELKRDLEKLKKENDAENNK
jgi:hypothetical protein